MKKILLLFVLFFCILLNVNSQHITLMQEVANMPQAISNNAVVEGWANDTPYVFSFGGIDTSKTWSGISLKSFRYNTITDIWDTIPPLPDTMGKIASAASYIDSIIYIIGGYHVLSNSTEISSNKVHRYDPRTNTYLSDGANIPVPIDDHVQAVYKDSLIYVITGWSNTGNVPNVQIYDPTNDNWLTGTPIPNNNTYKSFGASGIIIDSTIYYHGGASTGVNFPGQSTLRIGQINPTNPTQITWLTNSPGTSEISYRSVPAHLSSAGNDFILWLGGSSITYNFNGIAYNNSGGVNPRNEPIYFSTFNNTFMNSIQFNPQDTLPMDLRGIANFPSLTSHYVYIAGGMEKGQKVTSKAYKIWLEVIIGTDENSNTKPFNFFPNPTSDDINLVFEKIEPKTIRLFDILGNEVLKLKNNDSRLHLDVSNYSKGAYFLKVTTEKGSSSSQKIIIQ